MPSERTVAEEAEEHSEPLNGVIAGFREHSVTRSSYQNATADILRDVFLQAIPKNDDARPRGDNEHTSSFKLRFTRKFWAKAAPVNVSAVCRHWREVALSSPILWSTFTGYDKIGDMYGESIPWDHLDLFLLRSRNLPFNMAMKLRNSIMVNQYPLVIVFNNELARLNTVDIEWLDASIFWNIELANMPCLEIFRLHVSLDGLNRNYFVRVHLVNAPRLRHLFLAGSVTVCYTGQLAFENLTHISISGGVQVLHAPDGIKRGLSWYECLLLMRASPSLEAFTAHLYFFHSDLTKRVPYTTLSKLSVLDLAIRSSGDFLRNVLDNLCLPSLSELSLNTRDGVSRPCGLQSLLSRSDVGLKKLSVSGLHIAEVVRCLGYMPALQTFSVWRLDLWSAEHRGLLSRLQLRPDASVCPNLESIRFIDCRNNDYWPEELTAMICSRWVRSVVGDERRLKSVTFQPYFNQGVPYSDQLLAFCREGLIIGEEYRQFPAYE